MSLCKAMATGKVGGKDGAAQVSNSNTVIETKCNE